MNPRRAFVENSLPESCWHISGHISPPKAGFLVPWLVHCCRPSLLLVLHLHVNLMSLPFLRAVIELYIFSSVNLSEVMNGGLWGSFPFLQVSKWLVMPWISWSHVPGAHRLSCSPDMPPAAAPKFTSMLSPSVEKVANAFLLSQPHRGRVLSDAHCPLMPNCCVLPQMLNRKYTTDLIAGSFWLTETIMAVPRVRDTWAYSFVISLSSSYAQLLWPCFPPALLWRFPNCLFGAVRSVLGASRAALKQPFAFWNSFFFFFFWKLKLSNA